MAREDFHVAIIDFCGGITTENQFVSVIDMREKTIADCLSKKFSSELSALEAKYEQVLIAAPPVNASGVAVALSSVASVVLIVRWGKDTDEQVQSAVGYLDKDNLIGGVITDYRPNVDYIWEGQ
jgi:hypothetical protein